MESDPKLDRETRKLYEATARRCRGPTLILHRGHAPLAEAVREQGIEVLDLVLGGQGAELASLPRARFGAVVLVETAHSVLSGEDDRRSEIAGLLKPGGRLIAVVPNPECTADSDPEALNRRALRRLLKPLGKPRLATEQPYRWLTMYVDRPRQAKPRVHRARRDRYHATARLCRGRVIELGCGEGDLTRKIHDRGLEVMGVDISREKIQKARELHPGITFLDCDICALDLPPQSFDTVVIAEVLEHVDEKVGAEMLRRAWSFLRPRGRLVVSVPNEDCIPHPHHVRVFDRRGLKRLLAPLGKPRLVTEQPYKWLMMFVTKA